MEEIIDIFNDISNFVLKAVYQSYNSRTMKEMKYQYQNLIKEDIKNIIAERLSRIFVIDKIKLKQLIENYIVIIINFEKPDVIVKIPFVFYEELLKTTIVHDIK